MTGNSGAPRAARAQANTQLAGNLQRARLRRGLSVEALARLARVGRSTISQIERGGCAPTINVVARLSRALRVDLARLVAGQGTGTSVLRRGQPQVADGVAIRALVPAARAVGARFFQLAIGAAHCASLDALRDAAGEHATILVADGRLRIELVDETHDLMGGDAVVFRLDQPHALLNRGVVDATLYVVIAPRPALMNDGSRTRA